MIVRLGKDWRITADSMQFIIQSRGASKDADRWRNVSYHHDLEHAVVSLAQRQIRGLEGDYDLTNLLPLLDLVAKLKSDIVAAIKEAGLDSWSTAEPVNDTGISEEPDSDGVPRHER